MKDVSNPPPDTTLPASWDGLDEAPEEGALMPGARVGRYRILELLGHGGMGAVYLAEDEEGRARVAVKTLHRAGAEVRERLKREFRSIARVRHPQLVQLYELYGIGEQTFFTMEHVEGGTLTGYLDRFDPGSPEGEARLRTAFTQLAEGLLALHGEDLLHLDLKPDNVLVSASGQIKILDFGLSQSVHTKHTSSTSRRSGTPRYMAPEVLAGALPTTAADWFAYGVILHQVLTKIPLADFSGNWPPGTPEDLRLLATDLLSADAAVRPGGEQVLARLGGQVEKARPAQKVRSTFVGRTQELEVLRAAFKKVQAGEPQWIEVLGESGVGKSSLVSVLTEELQQESHVLVFAGCCHERESTPFQGLDGAMESVAEALRTRFQGDDVREEMRHAATIFPALCPGGEKASDFPPELDPVLRRRYAFFAIRRLFERITQDHTAVVVVDDLQWGDRDGARLLSELLSAPTPRRLLLITTRRGTPAESKLFIDEVEQALSVRGSEIGRQSLTVGRLAPEQARACLSSYGASEDPERTEAILEAAGGLPFLIEALGRHAWSDGASPTLKNLIKTWIKEAPKGAFEVLQAVALSPGALPQRVAFEEAGDANLSPQILAALRHASLVRSAGETPDGPLEPYHAMVGQAVVQEIEEEEQTAIRLRVARSLETNNLAGPEQLATIFHLAGELGSAGRYAPLAAREAEEALAFDTAAEWYARSIDWNGQERLDWLVSRGRCLKNAGREASAAECFKLAAEKHEEKRSELLRKAGFSYLCAGYVEEGMGLLKPQLRALGLELPRTPQAAALRLAPLLLGMWWRGIKFTSREEADCSPDALETVDASWECAKAIGILMPMQGLVMHLSSLKLALAIGEPKRIARSLGLLSAFGVGSPMDKSASTLMARALQLSEECVDDYLRGSLLTFRALHGLARGDSPLKIRADAEEGLKLLRRCPDPSAWEEQTASGMLLISEAHLGRIREVFARGTEWLAEASDRGDLFAQILASQALTNGHLFGGRIKEARRYANWPFERWNRGTFTVQHYYAVRFLVQCDLYEGNVKKAHERFFASYDEMKSAQLLRHPISRPEILAMECMLEIEALRAGDAPLRRVKNRVLDVAQSLMSSGVDLSVAHGLVLKAAIHAALGQAQVAEDLLRQAILLYEQRDFFLFAQCTKYRLAELQKDTSALEILSESFVSLGYPEPHRVVLCLVPSFTSP